MNDLAVLFTYFLVREVGGSLAKNVDVKVDQSKKLVTWRLSVSKTDPMALGAERSWGVLVPQVHLHMSIPRGAPPEDTPVEALPGQGGR